MNLDKIFDHARNSLNRRLEITGGLSERRKLKEQIKAIEFYEFDHIKEFHYRDGVVVMVTVEVGEHE